MRWQQKRRRLRLRLINGKKHLLSEEIASRLDDLAAFDTTRLAKVSAEAEAGLNSLHTFLMDRQAHLQNYEELLHLQRHKIAVQLSVPADAASHLDTSDEEFAPTGALTSPADEQPETTSHSATLGEHREKVEQGLIDKIKQLEEAEAARKSGRRR